MADVTGTRPTSETAHRSGIVRAVGLGIVTGAADDDPSAIGTYAAAGAKLGPKFLWTAPVTLPMIFAVVYLSAKLGQVSGKGLFAVIRDHYSKRLLWITLVGVLIGNVFEAAADLGGMAAAIGMFIPLPFEGMVTIIAATILAVQVWGSYELIRNIFRWLALTLFTYVVAAFLAKPDLRAILQGTLIPTIQFNKEFLSLLVAVIGTSLSAYLCRTRKSRRRLRSAAHAYGSGSARRKENCVAHERTSSSGWCSRIW